jgi:hypothetical protein
VPGHAVVFVVQRAEEGGIVNGPKASQSLPCEGPKPSSGANVWSRGSHRVSTRKSNSTMSLNTSSEGVHRIHELASSIQQGWRQAEEAPVVHGEVGLGCGGQGDAAEASWKPRVAASTMFSAAATLPLGKA